MYHQGCDKKGEDSYYFLSSKYIVSDYTNQKLCLFETTLIGIIALTGGKCDKRKDNDAAYTLPNCGYKKQWL